MHSHGIYADEIVGKAYDQRLLRRFARYLRPYRWNVVMVLLPAVATIVFTAITQPSKICWYGSNIVRMAALAGKNKLAVASAVLPGLAAFRYPAKALLVSAFVVIPAAYGAAMPWMTERLLREGSILRRTSWAWMVGLAPLLFANVVGLLILLVAFGVWTLGRAAPGLSAAWRSQVATWLGRTALIVVAVTSGAGLVRDSLDILG